MSSFIVSDETLGRAVYPLVRGAGALSLVAARALGTTPGWYAMSPLNLKRRKRIMTHRERLERKLELREEWSEKRQGKAAGLLAQNQPSHGDVAFNTQPGHIPERARVISRTDRAFEHLNMADHHTQRAEGLKRQLDRSVFSDDENAIEALENRIAEREAQRERMKLVNRLYKKGDAAGLAVLGLDLETMKTKLAAAGPYWGSAPHLPYELTNLGASMRKDRERIEEIKRRQAKAAEAQAAPNGVVLKRHGQDYCSVTFAEKPERHILDDLKAAGFNWGAGSWVGKYQSLPASVSEMAIEPQVTLSV